MTHSYSPISSLLTVTLALLLAGCANYQIHTLEDEPGLTADVTPVGEPEYSTFMVGDLGYDYERGLTTLDAMVRAMPPGKKKSSLMLLGDITGEKGLRKKDGDERDHLDAIGKLLGKVPGKVFYTPGENEIGNDGKFGRLDRLEDYFDDNEEKFGKKVRFMPNNVCSGPDDEEIFERVGLLGINTAWYMADWTRDEEVSEGCDYRNRDAMMFALIDEIKGYRDQVKIVMMHHPLQSNGNRGGKFSLSQHLFPLADVIPGAYVPLPGVGSVVRAVQSVGGGPQDIHNLRYQQFINKLKSGIDDEINVIFVSGHEHNMMLAHEKEYVKITAGSGSVRGPANGGNDANFVAGQIGYSRLDFYPDGSVFTGFYTVDEAGNDKRVYYRRIIENRHLQQDENIEEVPVEKLTDSLVMASVFGEENQESTAAAKTILGRHYRGLYNVPIKVPVLNVEEINGGLTPYRRGGGMATMSLHTAGGDGHLYQMRSVRKNPSQLLPSLLEQSFAADLVADVFTSVHPYAPLTLPPMQKKLGLYGADPGLYYVPKQTGLGDYNTNFGGELYWLEQRPDEDWSGTEFFGGSKEIISNNSMREEVRKSWKEYVDDKNFARARLFDIWIGDWDRHRDQWRWAAFPDGKRTRYVAVARDRDQVYSNYDGLLLGIARVFVGEARKFRPFTYELDKVKWRAFNGKWNDRVFLNQITREEMKAEAETIVNTLTDDVIDEALDKFPPEVKDYSLRNELIGEKLKSRREALVKTADDYYLNLAARVNVLGTEKDDYITAEGLENGDLHVRLYDAKKKGGADELYYDRVFHGNETKEVVIYGLDGDDHFVLDGAKSTISLRLIGGTDGDLVTANGRLRARVYDEVDGIKMKGETKNLMDRTSDGHPDLNQYDFEEYKPNTTVPVPAIGFNVDDGIFIGAGFSTTLNGFKPDPYSTRHTFLATYSTNEFYKLKYDGIFNDFFHRKVDLTVKGRYNSPGSVANFFGIGNESPGQPEEGEIPGLDEDDELEYNRARREEVLLNPEIRFRGENSRRSFSVGPFYQSIGLDDDTPEYTLIRNTDGIPDRVFDKQNYAGIGAHFSVNSLAIPLMADNGLKYDLYAKHTWNLDNSDLTNFKIGGQFSFYRMVTKAINFATRVSFEHNEGTPEYYQLASMGGGVNYRAARADRYLGHTLFTHNVDLRFLGFSLGKKEAPTIAGFILGFDYGRVWLEGEEESDMWHIGYGGGLWAAPLGATILSLTYFQDSEQKRIAFAAGFPF
ncbi:hypothetical protein FUA23_06400 [Neolewinella aurantiaca]|uniref:Calcineurin-like phosphoesterase domain-containing protein n=1 Tax=Neolewinella aurantiaca TaxID=2602767 RepID=A0A5C7FKE3_9BACT|nr:hypothetical protein [Neolewinella aurantiaca]TXF90416.1 hypothetical protein FUA23_06400 [Neolewinella aurantiaca]